MCLLGKKCGLDEMDMRCFSNCSSSRGSTKDRGIGAGGGVRALTD